jgi:hypothetical protein
VGDLSSLLSVRRSVLPSPEAAASQVFARSHREAHSG